MTIPAKKKLTQAELDRLAKLLGIMLASNFAGERDNAEAQATRILQKVGLTLAEYQASLKQVAVAQGVQALSQQPAANWRDMIKFYLTNHADQLSDWELLRFDKWVTWSSISPGQWAKVQEVHERLTMDRSWRKGRNLNWEL